MKSSYREFKILSNREIEKNLYKVEMEIPPSENDEVGKPGQFYMVRGWEAIDLFLPRPISISDIEGNVLTMLYEVRGKGTHLISKKRPGDSLELLGPVGTGFDTSQFNKDQRVALIAGGIGIAPLLYVAKDLNKKGLEVDVYAGFRDEIYYIDELEPYVNIIKYSTETGSHGHKGFVTDLIKMEDYDIVFTCGPIPMMKKVMEIASPKNQVYISMEARMACGVGACLGCSIETKRGMERVCKEGPVFLGDEVVF